MTKEQEEYLYALNYFGFELKEITKRDLDLVYLAYNEKLNPELTDIEAYKNGYEYKTMMRYYNLLSDVRKTNEIINQILNPEEEVKTITPEIVDNYESQNNSNYEGNEGISSEPRLDPRYTADGILDRPSVLSIILSVLIPLYGFLVSAFTWRLAPKAAKWYLVSAILGFIINFLISFLTFYMYNK